MPGRPPADSDDEPEEGPEYMLGFLDDPERPTDLLRHRFPSKVGGAPAWLDPLNLPTPAQLTCGVSGEALRFLLQVYCPASGCPVEAFHRTLFLFISPRGDELAKPGAVRALRCQLRRANAFYGDAPAPEGQAAPVPLGAAEAALARERDPWRVVDAEAAIAGGAAVADAAAAAAGGVPLFAEQELVVEPEPSEDGDDGDDEEGQGGAGARRGEVARLLAAYNARAFQARTALAPEQCLRYCFQPGAAPLWPSHECVPAPGDIPPCPHCGAARRFEFQVMPQLLSLMELDPGDPHAPDWGTIAVYSCPASCTPPPVEGPRGPSAYVEEFVWVQPS
ncbi:PDCD2 [Scenedesmus sp. PABB004]|nr:PDCD2 [Scenedesmus sp. PABB004]